MSYRMRYVLVGVIFGLGAPIGSLLWRALVPVHSDLFASFLSEWRRASYFYNYMTVGSVLAFGLFGYGMGRRNENLRDLSVTDGLTLIYNHRYLQDQLTYEIQRVDRYHTLLSCLMLDIDDFKKVNDQHGHLFGDKVLATIARLIRKTVRQIDIVGRYGGEEFLVIMPQTGTEAASPIAERILKAIQSCPFPSPEGAVSVTLSIGLATYPAPGLGIKTKNGLLSAADQALYKAKTTGKNRMVVWQS